VVLVVLVGLLAVSAVAMAEHEVSPEADSQFSFGYDELNHFLAINIEEIGETRECDLQTGEPLPYLIAKIDGDGIIQVDLEDPYIGCEVNGVVVAGPNGQINHGQFMKAAKSLLGIKGGCLVRYLAQSDIGRTDETTVSTSEAAETSFEPAEDGDITFSTFDADCSRGKDKMPKAENENRGRSNSHGKSASALGRNK